VARILIADDHAVVRAGYQPFLDADPSTSLVGEAASGSETIAQLRRSEWDLLLLDIHMPDRNGLDVLALVTSGYPKVRTFFSAPRSRYGWRQRPPLNSPPVARWRLLRWWSVCAILFDRFWIYSRYLRNF
jgi:CheY-like chemotaxis protein